MDWPVSHIRLICAYLGTEPSAEERAEYAIAQMTSILVNVNRAKGKPPARLSEFLIFRDAWKKTVDVNSSRYSAADKLMLTSLMSIGKPRQ